MSKWSINTFSLERELGPLTMTEWNEEKKQQEQQVEDQPLKLPLQQLPWFMKERGYEAAEVSYSQFPQTDDAYLKQLRHSFQTAGVDFASLLLDYADLSTDDSVRREADLEWCRRWIEIAAKAGAHRVRITAGESSPQNGAALKRSVEGFTELANYAVGLGIRLLTENLGKLLSTSENCRRFLESSESKVGLTADFGNFKQDNYRQLAEILPFAETVHVKAALLDNGELDTEDFRRCIRLMIEAGFEGPLSLTYLGEDEPWDRLDEMRTIAEEEFKATTGTAR
jgi:sugar phosphate isomerase/epimerase